MISVSFTASVKDELSRIDFACPTCEYAFLSAILRICGTLSLERKAHGMSPSVVVSTETSIIARMVITKSHRLFDMDTYLTVRHSNLHKTRNYMLQIPAQKNMDTYLKTLEILDDDGVLHTGVPIGLLKKSCCKQAFLRGCFMAGGFIRDPRASFHLEIACASNDFAEGVCKLGRDVGITIRINRRRSSIALYIKSFNDIVAFLSFVGATRLVRAFENVRRVKHLKNDVNRRVNAELANQARTSISAADQMALIKKVETYGEELHLTSALKQFCEARKAYPEASLVELGELVRPRASKSAMYHRFLRLKSLVEAYERRL